MFEKRTKKERTIIYVVIAVLITLLLALMHYLQGLMSMAAIVGAAIIEFFCIFYILYLPLKNKKE